MGLIIGIMAEGTNTPDPRLIQALQEAIDRELRAAQLYRLLGDREPDSRRREIFYRLADAESGHAVRFGERITALGGTPRQGPSPVRLADRVAAQLLGAETMLRRMEVEEERNIAYFDSQASIIDSDPTSRSLFEEIEGEEKEHSHLLGGMRPHDHPAGKLEAILKGEKWHVSTGSWIGDAIYGINDGLGAVFGIVSGMAGYTGNSHQVVVAGMFGMLASALSMGSGAFLATKSEREVYEAEIARERREILESPEHEREELALIYQLKGFTEEESRRMADTIGAQPELFLKTMAQEELGLSDRHFPSPWISMVSAALSTALGAFIPVLPFLFARGMSAVVASAVISTLAHFAVGAAKSVVTARSWFASGMEMTVVGVVEAVITYGLGVLFKMV